MAKGFSITNSVLNKASLDIATSAYKITPIEPKMILPNKDNFYNVSDVSDLKESINQQGLQQPLLVSPNEDDSYTIVSGHRRYKAIVELIAEGNDKFETIPCKIVELSENERMLALISANATSRELTDYEKVEQVRQMKETLKRLKEDGYSLSGRQRDLIAAELGMSATQVQRMEFIDKNLTSDFKQQMAEEKVPLTVAESIAKLPEKEQKKLYKDTIAKKDEVSQKDVDAAKNKTDKKADKKAKEKTLEALAYDSYIISTKEMSGINGLMQIVMGNLADGVTLSKKDYAMFLEAQAAISKQMELISDIVSK